MKTTIKITLLLSLIFALGSCDIKEALSTEIDVKDKVVEFDLGPDGIISGAPQASRVASASSEVTLLDRTFDVNIEEKLSDYGFSLDLIKSVILSNATLEVPVPESENVLTFMQCFNGLKIYFDDKSQLVAQLKNIKASGQTGIVEIEIVNGELINKLKSDQFHIIITGEKFPAKRVHCTLTTSYKVKVGIIK